MALHFMKRWVKYPVPDAVGSPPSQNIHFKGEMMVDDDTGEIWVCTQTGNPGTWTSTEIDPASVSHGDLTDHAQEALGVIGASGAARTLDIGDASLFDVTLSANCTFTFAGSVAGKACSFTLVLRQDGTGGRSVTWPGSVKWTNGSAPSLVTTASSVAVLTFFTVNNGSTWMGFLIGDALA